jgi:hypothetical protein
MLVEPVKPNSHSSIQEKISGIGFCLIILQKKISQLQSVPESASAGLRELCWPWQLGLLAAAGKMPANLFRRGRLQVVFDAHAAHRAKVQRCCTISGKRRNIMRFLTDRLIVQGTGTGTYRYCRPHNNHSQLLGYEKTEQNQLLAPKRNIF